jgi:hypothetical protein
MARYRCLETMEKRFTPEKKQKLKEPRRAERARDR